MRRSATRPSTVAGCCATSGWTSAGERARRYAVYTALEDLAYGLETGDDRYRDNALAALDEFA